MCKPLAVALALLLQGALLPPASAQEPPRPHAVAVAERVWMVQGVAAQVAAGNRNFIANAAFVVTDDGVVVIDALGSPALARELLDEIRRITPQPVRLVIVTHYHADHFWGLQAFKEAGARVLAQRRALEYLNSDTAAGRLKAAQAEQLPGVDARTRLEPADEWIDDEPQQRRIGNVDFVIQPLGPAHTPEDLVVFLPGLRTLMTGDLFFRGRLPFVGTGDSARWIAALERLIAFDAQTVIPGHGPASGSVREDLQLTRDYLVHLRRSMGEAARNMEPFEEAYARTDWSRFEQVPLFKATNRINAFNTYLLMERAEK